MASDESKGGRPAPEPDPDETPFERPGVAGIPFGKDSVEARAIREVRGKYAAARAKAGPGEFAYTDDSPFPIPPRS